MNTQRSLLVVAMRYEVFGQILRETTQYLRNAIPLDTTIQILIDINKTNLNYIGFRFSTKHEFCSNPITISLVYDQVIFEYNCRGKDCRARFATNGRLRRVSEYYNGVCTTFDFFECTMTNYELPVCVQPLSISTLKKETCAQYAYVLFDQFKTLELFE